MVVLNNVFRDIRGGESMFAKLKAWFQRPVVQFIALTVFYFAVMLALVYLYGYSGINQAKFIYNEF